MEKKGTQMGRNALAHLEENVRFYQGKAVFDGVIFIAS